MVGMKKSAHRAITEAALREHFSQAALREIVSANQGQDALRFQFGHPYFHYDDNSFAESDRYVAGQRSAAVAALDRGDASAARAAFGRLTHAVQDFYAHSTYIPAWIERFGGSPPPPQAVEILDADLLRDPALHSGRLYYPLEALAFVGPLARYVARWLPPDSHAQMNIDGPERPHFAYACAAAVKRTVHEFEGLAARLDPAALAGFTGRGHPRVRRL